MANHSRVKKAITVDKLTHKLLPKLFHETWLTARIFPR